MSDLVANDLRRILAEVTDSAAALIDALPEDTRLFADLGLDSSAGIRLISAVRETFGVDIAAEDLNLDSLESIASLRDFINKRRA